MVLGLVFLPTVLVAAEEENLVEEEKIVFDAVVEESINSVPQQKQDNQIDFVIAGEAPSKPAVSGPVNCDIGRSYTYTIVSTDPQDDMIYYKIRCSDMPAIYLTEFYQSGEEIQFTHCWSTFYQKSGPFKIYISSIDEFGHESDTTIYEVDITDITFLHHFVMMFQNMIQRLIDLHPILEAVFSF